MVEESINDSLWARVLTLVVVKILTDKHLQRFWEHPGGVLFASKFCIKIRHFESLAEAHTMRFVANHTSIPVPKVYCAFIHRGWSYTVMEKIEGEIAGRAWNQRPKETKAKIIEQLRGFAEQLRKIDPPNDIGVANVLGGPIYDARLPGKAFRGPFKTMNDFHTALRNGIELDGTTGVPEDLQELAAFHKRWCSRPVLTHGDLSSLNVLVRDGNVVGIIDWETAGWYPDYWEYVRAWNVNPQNEFWRQEVDGFLTPMSFSLRMENIRLKYFGDF